MADSCGSWVHAAVLLGQLELDEVYLEQLENSNSYYTQHSSNCLVIVVAARLVAAVAHSAILTIDW